MENQEPKNVIINTGRLKHLEMLQQIITRMAGHSFLVKGWSITLIAALLVLMTKDKITNLTYIALLPVIAFWVLDAFFIKQERLFRKLYDLYRKQPQDTPTDFSMDTSVVCEEVSSWCEVMFSKTLAIFHGLLLGLIIAVIFFVKTT